MTTYLIAGHFIILYNVKIENGIKLYDPEERA